MQDIRILHIIDSLDKGGAEVLLINCIKEYKIKYPESNHVIVTLKNSGDSNLINIAQQICKFVSLKVDKANFLCTCIKFRQILIKERIDVIHSHLLNSTLFARILKPKNTKLVSTYHNIVYDVNQVHFSKWRYILDKITYRDSYFSIFVSNAVSENIKTSININANNKVLINFAGREFSHLYKFNPENRLKFVMVGNLKPNKNHEAAILALSEFKDFPIELDIYGEGELKEYLQDLINKTKANVNLKGKCAISSELLVNYDAFLMTSLNEGMPIALIEAIVTGLPSILNDLPMLRETAGSAGIFYKANSIEDLIKTIMQILSNKHVLSEAANEAVRISQRYSYENYIKNLNEIYTS